MTSNSSDLVPLMLQGTPRVITSGRQLKQYTGMLFALDSLEKTTNAQDATMELLTLLIETYENEHFPVPQTTPIEVLKYLMEANNLRQRDLIPELGGVAVISLILSGKRSLTAEAIEKLSERFHVSRSVFIASSDRA